MGFISFYFNLGHLTEFLLFEYQTVHNFSRALLKFITVAIDLFLLNRP